MPPADCAVSPPARGTLNSSARSSSPFKKRSTHFWGTPLGTASDKNAASRLATHRRDVAQSARQAAPPHQFRAVPIPPEMHLLDGEVGGHQQLVSWRNAQHRAQSSPMPVTTDSPPPARAANLLNQFLFAKSA
jgi:hypothetical protein